MTRFIATLTCLLLAFTSFGCQARPDAQRQVVRMFVSDQTQECVGEARMNCLLIREENETKLSLFYEAIDGFIYEPGYQYELLVLKEGVENPPADGSSINYTLIKLLSRSQP